MRGFYLVYQNILQTPSAKLVGETFQTASGKMPKDASGEKAQTVSAQSTIVQSMSEEPPGILAQRACRFPLPWSHYVLLLKVEKPEAREFYEAEAHRNGWTVRQITTLFYERTLTSRNKGAMLRKGAVRNPGEALTPEEEIKDPFVLEFLGLKDEYSESDLEKTLV